MVILQGSEELAAVSTLCCLRTLPHLTTVDPASNVFEDVRQQYTKTFPIEADFIGLPCYHRLCIIHNVFHPSHKRVRLPNLSFRNSRRPKIQWRDYKLSSAEYFVLDRLAVFEYQRKRHQKVSRWILCYGDHLLSQDTLPPVEVVVNCLTIIAMDLGRTISNPTTLDERYVRI